MARTNEEFLRAEREGVQRQVDLFERKHGQTDTIWHTTLKRLDKEIAKIEQKKKPKEKIKRQGGPLPKDTICIVGEPGPETIDGSVLPEELKEVLEEKENNDG